MKVYVVTSGDYSDYHIERVFSTRELAEQWAGKKADVEEYELDDLSNQLISVVKVVGNIISGHCKTSVMQLREDQWNDEIRVGLDIYNYAGIGPKMSFFVRGEDIEGAGKIFGEKRAQFLAQGSGLEIKKGSYDRNTLALIQEYHW